MGAPLPAVPVAVVSDDPLVVELVRLTLDKPEYEVTVYSPADADAVVDEPPALLVTSDAPAVLDLIAAARAVATSPRLGIVHLTASEAPESYHRAFAAGVDECLRDRTPSGELKAKCARLLARARADDAPALAGLGTLGRYTILEVLGSGSYASVYRAVGPASPEPVALKVLSRAQAVHPEARTRLLREVQALQSVETPHLPRLVDFGSLRDVPYYAMELIPGPSLHDEVRRRGSATPLETIDLLVGVAEALKHLHAAGFLHRDVKPQNIVLREGRLDQPVLVDLGLAKLNCDDGVTRPDVILGTPGFMPPELLIDHGVDVRSDLYSLGMVGRFCLTGELIYPELSGIRLLQALAERGVSLPASTSPELAAVLGPLVHRLPEERPGSARVVIEVLREARARLVRRDERRS